VFPNVEVRHLHAVIALGEELNFTEGSNKSRMTMPTAANQWNWKFQHRDLKSHLCCFFVRLQDFLGIRCLT